MGRLILLAIFICGFSRMVFSQFGSNHHTVSEDIEIVQVSKHVYVHVSYADAPGFGRVASNGALFVDGSESLLFDTPMTDSLTARLVRWITDSLHTRIIGFVPNHWHDDCMGGLNYIHNAGIPSYANDMTIAIAKSQNLPLPRLGFSDSLRLQLGGEMVVCKYYGPAHSKDNIVVWMPTDSVLFAGCMAKELRSKTLGNLSDADLAGWPGTIARVIAAFPDAKVVVPGHGAFGGRELLTHTLELLKKR
jgi:metallo-beta-lactamase class B